MNIALVTGASSGFGQAICRKLVADGYKVIGVARRGDKLQKLADELGINFTFLTLDVTKKDAIESILLQLPKAFQPIDILINNAGLALGLEPAYQADFNDWETMIQTNIMGLIHLTHQILPSMVERNFGYIINIGSVAGTYAYKGGNVYGATKAFVKQFSANLRTDLLGKKIRVTNIEPGLCGGTEFSNVRFHGNNDQAAAVYKGIDYITPEDIANTISWLVNTPAHFNVNSLEIMPVAQAPAGLALYKESE
ncbi:NADP-dependent 3-hydroxy acid dehydrogenase [Gilliamella sp. Fer1-1]|jgi:3-hydroxy acid dehydrogenase / malonic semialdehyde reductase|uniref:SDR family NAD(P)-dependent oxidoreductase n=1 Tax=unclassified Gilliamella TaxID=2685620 RepID=UPI00080E1FB8|nr:SDR family NAD(P)-dependent oxidoreductase [Gilliamella apicola]OCG18136.1 NADP-dependent 3-hydroxy acid dehydrogenase [Gilliamella apicola]OCG25123.1 NADP-dependent 3-hydroxy acid dehydrogenase [Gilliamella apicola]OCG28048.1 NADP-dependent 3-hydroxy acid dehydrogenase [Gilliamella apicola]OCG39080.1 NADP-dependent 3-hydroxy acid dehydrogenase [Gilliamella apicola]OCG39550.1 NADP-dependent 3-hydroxy acid dehydrogenase [Gilliamella apicola]